MAGKATIADIANEGFQPSQFGSPPTFSQTGGLIDTALLRASNWATQRVTPTNYTPAASPSYAFDCLQRAEIYYVSADLWTRRTKFLDGSANIALDPSKVAQLSAQYLANAEEAMCDANYWIGEAQRTFGLDPTADMGGTGISTGYIETGQFPQTSPQPLNVEA
jgi:hypothetical protein